MLVSWRIKGWQGLIWFAPSMLTCPASHQLLSPKIYKIQQSKNTFEKMDETFTTKTTSPDMALGGVQTTVMLSLSSEELWVIALAVPCQTEFYLIIEPSIAMHCCILTNCLRVTNLTSSRISTSDRESLTIEAPSEVLWFRSRHKVAMAAVSMNLVTVT